MPSSQKPRGASQRPPTGGKGPARPSPQQAGTRRPTNAQNAPKRKVIKKVSPSPTTHQHARKRRGRYVLYYILAGLFAVSLGVVLSLTVFFKIESIRVTGNTHYQEEAIVESTGILPGENLFRIRTDAAAEEILATYPYVEAVRIRRRLPVSVVVEITEAVPMGAFQQEDGSYVLVSQEGRVLQMGTGTPPGGGIVVSGVVVENVKPCDRLPDNLSESMTMFRYLKDAIEETGFADITAIDLSNRLNIRICYQDRLRIELGSEGDLADKLDFVKYAIANEVEDGFEGLVDVTIPGQVRIRKMEIHPDGYHPEQAVEPPVTDGEGEGEPTDGAETSAGGTTPMENGASTTPPTPPATPDETTEIPGESTTPTTPPPAEEGASQE